MAVTTSHWFVNRRFDLAFFHGPVWLCWVTAFLLPVEIRGADVPIWVWVGAVLMIDVGHVWSSIYRTYLDPVTRSTQSRILAMVPVFCFVPCFMLALHSDELVWRVLAYVATWHFIKQQVGVTALYRYHGFLKQSPGPDTGKTIALADKLAIYAGTLCPIIYWHLRPEKAISWFIPGDYLDLAAAAEVIAGWPGGSLTLSVANVLFYGFWIGAPLWWLIVHWRYRQTVGIPLGKGLWVFGTWFNWWLGIVYFDSDLVFTLTNVVAHGVPYYGLIALYGKRKLEDGGYGTMAPRIWRGFAKPLFYALMLMPLLLLAYGEEYLWNFLLYREHEAFFEALWNWPGAMVENPIWRAFWIAALSLPQTVHYILDGFIWKFNGHNPDLKQYLFPD